MRGKIDDFKNAEDILEQTDFFANLGVVDLERFLSYFVNKFNDDLKMGVPLKTKIAKEIFSGIQNAKGGVLEDERDILTNTLSQMSSFRKNVKFKK